MATNSRARAGSLNKHTAQGKPLIQPVEDQIVIDETAAQPEAAAAPKAAAPPPSPPAAGPLAPRASWARRLWTACLLVAVLVTGGGLALIYSDDSTWQHNTNELQGQKHVLQGQNESLRSQLTSTQTSLTASQAQAAGLESELMHPTLGIWNVKQNLSGATDYLDGGIPDTFTYHLRATSNRPMSVSILTFQQFAAALDCVHNGVANTNYCMHHSGRVVGWDNVTSIDYDFHLAEGCAGYLQVFTSAGPVTVTPDVSVTYNPAPAPTGACAG